MHSIIGERAHARVKVAIVCGVKFRRRPKQTEQTTHVWKLTAGVVREYQHTDESLTGGGVCHLIFRGD